MSEISLRLPTAPATLTGERRVLRIGGMDCVHCAHKVESALTAVPGVERVEVALGTRTAAVRLDPRRVGVDDLRRAVEATGCSATPVGDGELPRGAATGSSAPVWAFATLAAAVLVAAVGGEWLGWYHAASERLPWWAGTALVVVAGFDGLRTALRQALRGHVTAHALVTVGVVAALGVGEWITALAVVLFLRVADAIEGLTATRSRAALQGLAALAPDTARVERAGGEADVPADAVRLGEIVVVRPGERIPVDGTVVAGLASVDRAAVTGEAIPVEAGPGTRVFASSLVQGGALRVCAERVGADSAFGRMADAVARAETGRARVHRLADRVAAGMLPAVVGVALLTAALRGEVMAGVAVLVVACACSFALATPVAMQAAIAACARRGMLVKGGRHLEALARADVLLIDKTGTLTDGRCRIERVVALDGVSPEEVLRLAATVERFSEHPLAAAVREEARTRGVEAGVPEGFVALPGRGVEGRVGASEVRVGNRRLLPVGHADPPAAADLERAGLTTLLVVRDGCLVGVLGATDTLRPDVPEMIRQARSLGFGHIEVLTGDHDAAAERVAAELDVDYQAGLLPADKVEAVRALQRQGFTVVMVGDGVNDAPALAQADVGIAMGAAGTAVAADAADVVLLRDDWTLLPEAVRTARRTLRVVRANLACAVVYNVLGIALAALGLLSPVLAAALHSVPDLAILSNSARLLRPR